MAFGLVFGVYGKLTNRVIYRVFLMRKFRRINFISVKNDSPEKVF